MSNTLTAILPAMKPASGLIDLDENITAIPLSRNFTFDASMSLLDDPLKTLVSTTRISLGNLSPNELRKKILLETESEKAVRSVKVKIAKNLAQQFKDEASRLSAVYSQKNIAGVQPHIFMQRRLASADQSNLQSEVNDIQDILKLRSGEIPLFEPGTAKTSVDKFVKFLNYVIKKNNVSESDIDSEVVMLCAYYTLKFHDLEPASNVKFAGFDKLPDSFFDSEKDVKLKALAKHFFLDLEGYSTSRDIEQIKDLEDDARSHHMAALLDHNDDSIYSLIKNAFPGFTEGENPNIRLWLIRRKNMWQNQDGAILAARAVRFTLKYVAKVFNSDGVLDIDAVRRISRHGGWEAMLTNKENPLEGLVSTTPLRTIRQIVLLGLPELKGSIISELSLKIGQDHEKVSNEDMDKITEELVRIHCSDSSGEITNKAICDETRWAIRFNEVDKRIFVKSNFKNAYEALVHKYPERFGWKPEQIHPGDITFGNMWSDSEGLRLYRERFAFTLSSIGLGSLDVNGEPVVFTVSKEDLDKWISEKGQDPINYILKEKIRFPGFADVCKRNLTQAYKTFFRSNTNFGVLEKSFKRQLLTNLFEENSGTLRIQFGPILYEREKKEENASQVEAVSVNEEKKEEKKEGREGEERVLFPYPVDVRPLPAVIKPEITSPELGTRILGYVRKFNAFQSNADVAVGLIKGAFRDLDIDQKLLNNNKIVFDDEELKEKVRKYLVLSERSFDVIVKFLGNFRSKKLDTLPVRTLKDTDSIEY